MKTGIYWQDPEYPAKGMDFAFDPSLVLYLPLHKLDGASIMSKDAYGHLCTVTGALWRPNGRLFDGSDDWILLGSHSSLDVSYMTAEFWVNMTTFGGGNLVSKDATLFRELKAPTATGIRWIGVVASGAWDFTASTTNVVGAWYQVVYTWDGTTAAIYKNGVSIGTNTSQSGAGSTADNDLYIGNNSGSAKCIDGLIALLRIYNRALTPLEIQHNYLATKWRYR